MKTVFEDCRGSVLILTAWILALIGVIAAFLLYRSELEWAAVASLERNNQARQLAEEILQERLILLREDNTENDTTADLWFEDDGYFQYEQDGYQVTIKIEDEGSKANLNLLGTDELQLLDLEDEQLDSLLDWIDVDSDTRQAGAEADFYQSLTPGYKPRDGFISNPREVLAVKNGEETYEEVAPYCTVFGKYNINVLNLESLENLLLSSGFEKMWVERMVSDVKNYRSANQDKYFSNFDELHQLSAVSLEKLDQLRPLLTFTGIINLNFIKEDGLKVMLEKAGYGTDLAARIISRRQDTPFSDVAEAQNFFDNRKKPLKVELYFTTISTIIRYQIWLNKGKHTYYLETVQERVQDNGEWRLYPLSRCFLVNQEAPEVPEPLKIDTENDEE